MSGFKKRSFFAKCVQSIGLFLKHDASFFATKFSIGTKWCALMYCFYYIKFKNWKKRLFFCTKNLERTKMQK